MNILDMIEEEKAIEFDNAKDVRLVKLEIENYRAIEKETIEVNGDDIVFTGESGVGKTTRIEALLWLLSNRIFDGSTKELHKLIIPSGSNKETILSVEATFEVGSEQFVFTKKMKEKWVKKQGTDDIIYEGVDVSYYVNGTPKNTVKAFNESLHTVLGLEEAIERIGKETKLLSKVDLVMLLTVLDFFPTLDNKTLRELVLLVGGDVDLKSIEMDSVLRQALEKKNYDIDDLKKTIKLKLRGDTKTKGLETIKTELESELKVYQKQLEEAPQGKTTKEIQDEIDKLVDELSKIKTKLSKGDFEILQKHDLKLRELELRKKEVISKLKDEFANSKELDELAELRNETKEQLDEILEKIKVNNSKRESVEQSTKFKKGEINNLKLRGQTIVENVKTFKQQELQEITCPKCNHVFKHANEDVKVNVEKQVKEAKGLKGQIEQLEQDVKDFNEEIDELNEILETYQSDREELTNKLVEQDENIATLRENNEKALESLLEHKDVLSVVKEIKDLETSKNEELLNHTINVKKLEAKQVRLTEQRDELYQQRYALDNVEKAKEKVLEISKELKDTQKTINNFEKLQIDLKILEQEYLKAIDENIKQSFGENIRFKMFETNMSNENLIPTCEMYVKDQFGNWLPAVNGINTGHSVPRLVEFLVKVRKSLNIKNGLLLIDFFESIGNEPLKELQSMGQQIIATQVVRGQNELNIEIL